MMPRPRRDHSLIAGFAVYMMVFWFSTRSTQVYRGRHADFAQSDDPGQDRMAKRISKKLLLRSGLFNDNCGSMEGDRMARKILEVKCDFVSDVV